ncbi:MAG: gliding motility-associated C-terminal domain-containing protein [Flavobacteriales bacterium]|nr:gliding motility-associated C-terminal domain-containing protein [Flavobacteriales bacterium]
MRYKVTPTALYVNWINVGYYNSMVDKRNTFQVIITNGSDPAVPHGGNVSFCYKDMQWTTGSASGGSGGFGGTPATVGANRGTGGQYMQFGRFNLNNSNYDGPFGANDGVHWLDDKHFMFATDISSANVPPVATSETVCDSMVLCVGELADLDVTFLSPEPTQTTVIAVNAPTLTGLNIISNTAGVNATFAGQVMPTPADVGEHIVTFTATDNGSPVMTTVFEVVVIVQPGGQLDPGALTVCDSGGTTPLLPGLPGVPAGGTWTGPAGSAHSGIFNPAADAAGDYTYTVQASGSTCASTGTVTVSLEQAPEAGSDGAVALCADGAAVDLADHIGGSPDPGGVWLDAAGTPVGGAFDPATMPGGTYQYIVSGGTVCPDDAATVTVTVAAPTDAGGDATMGLCVDAPPFAMIGALAGSPQAGGAWAGPVAVPGGLFDPAVHPAGVYTYTVPGTAPCAAASATLTIAVDQAPWAGTNGQAVLCAVDAAADLFAALGGAPESGGTWQDPSGNPHSSLLAPGTDAGGDYLYTVAGQGQCDHLSATAVVAVTIAAATPAGEDASTGVCAVGDDLVMTAALGGTPPLNGTWSGPSSTGGVFVPGTHLPGTYTYTVPAVAPCPPQSATLTITLDPAPVAGDDAALVVCENAAATPLFPLLGGGAQPNGVWSDPLGDPFSGTLDPATAVPGPYPYVVPGQLACAGISATAIVTVAVQELPDPGTDASVSLCIDADPLIMTASLGGAPAEGGTWSGPSATNGVFVAGTHQPGAYTYTVPGTAPCPAQSATLTIGMAPLPMAGVDAQVALCANGVPMDLATQLGGQADGGGQWTAPDGTPATGMLDPATAASGPYTYVVQGAAPCAQLTDTAIVTVQITALPDPGLPVSLALCADAGPLDMTAALGGDPDPNGTWSGPAGDSDGSFVPGQDPPGVHTYTVPGTAPCPAQSTTLTLVVVPLPMAGPDGAVVSCVGAAPTDMATALQGGAGPGGTWYGPDGAAYNGWLDPAVQAAGAHLYVVTGTGPCTHAADTAVVMVTIDPMPEVSFTVEPHTGCHPLEAVFTNTTDPALVQSAQWLFGDGSAADAQGVTAHTYLAPGTFAPILQVTTPEGCTGIHQLPDPVVVDRAPEADFSFGPDPPTHLSSTVYFTAHDPNAVSHLWTLDGAAFSQDPAPQYTFPQAMSQGYTVCLFVEDVHGCADEQCRRVDMVVPQISVPTAFTPDGDGLNEVFMPVLSGVDPAHYTFLVADRWGRTVFRTTDLHTGWDGRSQGSGEALNNGVYVWQLTALPIGTAETVSYQGSVTLVR